MRRRYAALIGICLLTFFAGLGAPAIADSDEAFYAESAREMVELGDWLTPHFNYVYRFEKPILYYWLAAGMYVVAGVSETAARLPSAIAGLGLVLMTWAAARRVFDDRTAWLAGLVTATSFGAAAMARQALPDLPLACFITLAVWASWVAWIAPPGAGAQRPNARSRTAWVALAALGAAGAVLTKGPVGLLIPAIVIGPLLIWQRWTRSIPAPIRWIDLGVGMAVLILAAAPWYAAMALEHGSAYLERFFLAENFDRFTTARYNDPRPVWYYLPIVAGGLLPWSPFMLLWFSSLRRAAVTGAKRLTATGALVWWAAAPLCFYTLSVGKQPRYILPVLPPLAILLARTIERRISAQATGPLFNVAVVLTAVLLTGIGLLLFRAQPLLAEWDPAQVKAAAAAIVASGVMVLACLGRPARMPGLVAGAAIVVTLVTHVVVLASPGPAPVERIAARIRAERSAGETYGRHDVLHRNLIFYTRASFVELPIEAAVRDYLREPRRVLCVLPADAIPRLRAADVNVRSLSEVSYLNTGNLTLRTLIDPARDVQRIALVANQ